MNRRSLTLMPLVLLALLPRPATCADEIRHRFICVDNHGKVNRLIHVDQSEASRNWVAPIPGPRSRGIQILGSDRVLVSHFTDAAEYSLADGKKGWSIEGYTNVQTARRLSNGHTVLGREVR